MPIDKAKALSDIDAVIKRRNELDQFMESLDESTEIITLSCAVIRRLSPPGSAYLESMERAFNGPFRESDQRFHNQQIAYALGGVLNALRADYEGDRMQSFAELLHADLFSDFLEMAEYFLDEGFKDPAAVMAGGVLEEHLRKMCARHGICIPIHPKLDSMNADLMKSGAYTKSELKLVSGWADLRNKAAHVEWTKYGEDEVRLMIQGIRFFINKFPA
jgi:hypothetical protein